MGGHVITHRISAVIKHQTAATPIRVNRFSVLPYGGICLSRIAMSSTCWERKSQLLHDYEGKLVAVLKNEDMNSLSEDLYYAEVISEKTKDKLSSLDQCNLKPELIMRYLLLQVHEAVKDAEDEYVFSAFIS